MFLFFDIMFPLDSQLGSLAYFDFDHLYIWLCSKVPSNSTKLWPEAL